MFVKTNPDNTVAEFPYDSGLLKRDNPNTSFPRKITDEVFASHGAYRVEVKQPPALDEKTQKLVRDDLPAFENGKWTIGWNVVNKTPEELAEEKAFTEDSNRVRRNVLLAETDWYALSDVVMPDNIKTYRQALRDITAHSNWPYLEEADWPVKPE